MEPIILNEYKGIIENEKLAAIYAVSRALGETSYNDEIFFKKNLDPVLLNSHFSVNKEELCKDLNSPARMLFDTLLNESCHYIIEISSTLPGFELKATQELLKRESILLEKLQLILDSLPSHAVGENQAENIFETNYHRRIARILDILQIFGLSSDPIYTRYKLSIACISLSVSQEYGDGYLEDGVNYFGGPAEEVLSSKKRVLIRGEAGSGKTTLLQWIAVNAARNLFESNLLEWGNKTPFILQLRNYSSRELPTPDEFLIDLKFRHSASRRDH